MIPNDTDVLIVGAGPTGLALAVALQQAGVRHVIVDKLGQGQNTSRAAVLHAHTLETLESIGVAGRLADLGSKLPSFCVRDGDRQLLNLPFDTLDSSYPYLLMLPQDKTETVLADRLAELGGKIHRGATVSALEQTETCVLATVETPAGATVIRARYAVGADGMHSAVRGAAGIEFEGGAYADSFVLADVHMDFPIDNEVSLFFSAAGLVVIAPLPDGSYRVVATMANAPEKPDVADIQAMLDARGPTTRATTIKDVIWSSRFRVHHRLANSYRNNRLLIVGDAAHVHSPAGGQGMNCGLVDACVLGQLLSDVVLGKHPEQALDLYEELRRPAASQVLSLAGRLTTLATMNGGIKRAIRNSLFRIVDHIGPAKQQLMQNLSGLGRKAAAILPKVTDGQRMGVVARTSPAAKIASLG
jgi:2-polyprenyl-6-methoxyphenol hydroxylase-like FAD-dependent oxidoreductase